MRILLWHVHGAWTTAFVQGGHDYLVPTTPDRGPYGLGRARTYPWPDNVREVSPEALAHADVDVVLMQRPEEWQLAERWLRRRPGVDVPVVFVEHNTPKQGDVPNNRHPMADRDDVTLVHVTHYNKLIWDNGSTRTEVIEHGIPDPGAIWTGELRRIATAINEPIRRWRVTGTDLLPHFTQVAPVDVYGMKVTGLPERLGLPDDRMAVVDDPPQATMHAEIARRRVYLHPHRWTSLGLSLLEAMSCGAPVVVLATTETVMAVPPGAGVLSTNVDELVEGARWLASDVDAARRCGEVARRAAQKRYGLARFLADWDALLKEVTS
ncbi:glycosyltransferase family 4 protein [Planosporangium thailandense]|uniref:Glycosyltransferase family 4 protein n=1 Tax=Planosporangium thailandense TaxID=765197 RepID=A0ABX0XYZ6_9ACTN|nr:glycosyltransferase [Planosporangium thailandense]NJC71013.1 glycosyltransferase family 4 protein [Planosporangium thailandense]